jgi:hypothetical protein
MSPRVDRRELGSIEVSIKTSEHGNPHVHGWYQKKKIKVYIQTLDIAKSDFPPKEEAILVRWIEVSREYLLDKWFNITGLQT